MAAGRLFCARQDDRISFCVAVSQKAAAQAIGRTARYPRPDEVRLFWDTHGFSTQRPADIARQWGVTTQTVANWRARAGAPRYFDLVIKGGAGGA